MANPFVHVELATTDSDKSSRSTGSFFNWKLQDMPMGNGVMYTTIDPAGGTGGGMMKQMAPGAAVGDGSRTSTWTDIKRPPRRRSRSGP